MELLASLIVSFSRLSDVHAVPANSVARLNRASSTDSQGSAFVLAKFSSDSPTACAILVDLAALCDGLDASVEAIWQPRGHNTWADLLSKGQLSDFNPQK